MIFDFSEFYKRETVTVTNDSGDAVFSAVIRELSYGEKEDTKALAMSEVDIPMDKNRKTREQKMQQNLKAAMKNGLSAKMSIQEEVAAIESWTLEIKGEPVPVCAEALRGMPYTWAKQLVEVIERLNPDLDDDEQFLD